MLKPWFSEYTVKTLHLQNEQHTPKHFSSNRRMCVFSHKTPDSVDLKGSKTMWKHRQSQLACPLVDWHHILLETLLLSVTSLAYCLPLCTLSFHFLVVQEVHCFLFSKTLLSPALTPGLLCWSCQFYVGWFPPALLVSVLAAALHQHPAMQHFTSLNTTYQFT